MRIDSSKLDKIKSSLSLCRHSSRIIAPSGEVQTYLTMKS